jgi:hypothetical protein
LPIVRPGRVVDFTQRVEQFASKEDCFQALVEHGPNVRKQSGAERFVVVAPGMERDS